MRRVVATTTAVVVFLDAIVLAFINWVMGLAVRYQSMSLAGLEPATMSSGAWAAGGVLALLLTCCAVVLVRTARRDRSPGRLGRILLIGCAVTHGVLGALVVGPVGWIAFVAMMAVFALVVLNLVLNSPPAAPAARKA
jgi:hypothetical protein